MRGKRKGELGGGDGVRGGGRKKGKKELLRLLEWEGKGSFGEMRGRKIG